jgi:phosphoribosyl 1,2-cyclic phosphodiesterase
MTVANPTEFRVRGKPAMLLKFLGTRGEIEARSRRHRMHSSVLFLDRRKVMIDCGVDWLERIARINPDAILLTHAHPDHAGGLKMGSRCPVFATVETWEIMRRYPIAERCVLSAHQTLKIGNLAFEAFPVEHSLRAPAVGYIVEGGGVRLIYVPDVASITESSRVFAGVDIYIGDGASIARPLVRKRGNVRIGHASIAAQLEWCQREGVRCAIFTHCGSQIVAGDEQKVSSRLRELGEARGVEVTLAFDGCELAL